MLSRKSTLNFSQIRVNLIMLDGSLFSKTKPRTKQIYSTYSTYFLMYNQPVHDVPSILGHPVCIRSYSLYSIQESCVSLVLSSTMFSNVPETTFVSRRINRMRGELQNFDCRGTTSIFSLPVLPLDFPLSFAALQPFDSSRTIGRSGSRQREVGPPLECDTALLGCAFSRGRDSISSWQRARDDRSRRTPRFLCRFQHAPTVTDFDGIDQFIRSQISVGIFNCRHFRS